MAHATHVGLAWALAFAASLAGAQPTADCRIPGIRTSVLCGEVQRALDPLRPAGPLIDVHYIVVPALARRKLPDPVFLLAGGPGQSAIGVAPQILSLFSRLNNRRDIVFVDQRGTGRSAPLMCPDSPRESLADAADPERQLAQLARCKAELLKLSYVRDVADLGYFTTTLAMQDLDAVRHQLGAVQINLVGVSYGTRAALEYMRQFPSAVRRSVLDAVAPPDMVLPVSESLDSQAALDALFADCGRRPDCQAAYPRLRDDWATLLRALPKPVSIANPLTGEVEPSTVSRDMVLGAVRGALYAPATAAALPAAITAAAADHFEPLAGLAALQASRRSAPLAIGMHFSVVCAEDAPLIGRADGPVGADFGSSHAAFYQRACADWPRGAVPPEFYRIAPSTTPTLLLSGGLDPATPPRHAARVAAALGRSARHVIVPNAGHGALGIGCARDLLFRFIDASDAADAAALDATCLEGIPRPGVFKPIRVEAHR